MDTNSQSEPKPCGACLQYIHDFAENSKIEIVMAKARNGEVSFETVKVKTLKELLPFPFRK
jgi:cytidine deaminase